MCQIHETVNSYFISFLLDFYEHIYLGPNQWLRHIFYVLVPHGNPFQGLSLKLKNLINDWENILHIGMYPSEVRCFRASASSGETWMCALI